VGEGVRGWLMLMDLLGVPTAQPSGNPCPAQGADNMFGGHVSGGWKII